MEIQDQTGKIKFNLSGSTDLHHHQIAEFKLKRSLSLNLHHRETHKTNKARRAAGEAALAA